jgi:hypothetical protein
MALYGFKATESKILDLVRVHYSSYFVDDSVVATDTEAVLTAMRRHDCRYGASLEYELVRRQVDQKFRSNAFIYAFSLLLIHHCQKETMNDEIRNLIDTTLTLFLDDERLGGEVTFARVNLIGQYRPVSVQNSNYYFLPVSIDVLDNDNARR